jgi:Uma2 family endonuclease
MTTKTLEILEELEEKIDLDREYTAEEFALLPDDGNRYELIEGKLVMSPATRYEHGLILQILFAAIIKYLEANKTGKVFCTTGFYLGKSPSGKDIVLEPDLGFIETDRLPLVSDIYLPYPDLAIEVWSREADLKGPRRRAKARNKLQKFFKAGTLLAWGVNPVDETVEIFQQGQAAPVRVLNINDELDGENILPGFKLPVKVLFGK